MASRPTRIRKRLEKNAHYDVWYTTEGGRAPCSNCHRETPVTRVEDQDGHSIGLCALCVLERLGWDLNELDRRSDMFLDHIQHAFDLDAQVIKQWGTHNRSKPGAPRNFVPPRRPRS